jgi:hypothetical protein
VGADIVAGMKNLVSQAKEVDFFAQEIGKGDLPRRGFFAHGRVGKNESPKSKCEAFEAILREGLGKQIDIAFFKFCYLDIRARDNEKEILKLYKSTLDAMRLEYPGVRLIPVTAPLTISERGWKYYMKRMLGRETERANNIRRNRYNELLRETFKGEAIFDLAALESKRPDGSDETFGSDQGKYFSLVPEYSSDGSHLNQYGSQRIAKELILLLGRVISEKKG